MQYPRVTPIATRRDATPDEFILPGDRLAPRREPLHAVIAKYDAMRLAVGVNAKQ